VSTGAAIAAVRTPEELYELLDPDVMWYSADVDSNVTCNSQEDVEACVARAVGRGLTGRWELVAERADFVVVHPVVEGPELNPAFHQVFRVRDGLIVELRDFRTREEALEYAGIA
jgi:hypothetical protein